MGLFDSLFGGSSKSPKNMSDSELISALEDSIYNGKSLAERAALIKEAKRRGFDIPQA